MAMVPFMQATLHMIVDIVVETRSDKMSLMNIGKLDMARVE